MTKDEAFEIFKTLSREDQQKVRTIEFELARAVLKIGDKVRREMCGGGNGTFVFDGFDGQWLTGKTIYDCAACNVISINRVPVNFSGDAMVKFLGDKNERSNSPQN